MATYHCRMLGVYWALTFGLALVLGFTAEPQLRMALTYGFFAPVAAALWHCARMVVWLRRWSGD